MIVLQIPTQFAYLEYLLSLLLTFVAIGMGLYITFQAYRGFRRNQNRRMLYLALGLALITVIPFGLTIAVTLLSAQFAFSSRIYTSYLPLLSRLMEIVGLGCIIYSLRISSGPSQPKTTDQKVRIQYKEK